MGDILFFGADPVGVSVRVRVSSFPTLSSEPADEF